MIYFFNAWGDLKSPAILKTGGYSRYAVKSFEDVRKSLSGQRLICEHRILWKLRELNERVSNAGSTRPSL